MSYHLHGCHRIFESSLNSDDSPLWQRIHRQLQSDLQGYADAAEARLVRQSTLQEKFRSLLPILQSYIRGASNAKRARELFLYRSISNGVVGDYEVK